MISACETQEFIPFGRRYIEKHPGIFQLQVQNHISTENGVPLVKSLRDISITDSKKPKEQWSFKRQNKYTSNEEEGCDEELYVNGNTVIWSNGGQGGTQQVLKTFTMDTPVLQALWFDFILPTTETVPDVSGSLDIEGELQTGVCVVELGSVSCFCQSGKEYSMALPFQIASVWKMKNGLLFERAVSAAESNSSKRNFPNQTTVFSMLHCLDEVAPVIMRTNTSSGVKVSYMTDTSLHIVYTSVEPSLALIYDSQLGVHSAWRIQKAKIDDCSLVCGTLDNSLYHPVPGTPLHNQSSSSSRFFGNVSSQTPSISPLRNFSGRLSSPGPGLLHLPQPISPVITNVAASRSQSPAVPSSSFHRFHSPSPSLGRHSGNYFRTPPVCSNNVSLINESFTEWVEPLRPELCFEHMWTEPAPAIRDGSLGKSSKVFKMKDLCGQQYLCYLITYRQQLRCVKFEESNDLSQLIFGTVSVIPAKDALPIEGLNMLVILDPNGVLFIYSGVTKLNRLHVSTLPLGSGSLSMLKPVTPMTSPQRGGIFTSSRPPSAMDQAGFDEEITRLSPVQTDLEDSSHFDEFPTPTSYIQGLRDNVGTRFTIELINGSMCRAMLPQASLSPGIEKSLQSLKHMLPRDVAITVLGKWYVARNSPGGLGNQSEWTQFTKTLLGLMGYDTSRLALTIQDDVDISISPSIVAKKPKQSDQGSEDDWETLIGSDHHKLMKSSIESCLGFRCFVTPEQACKHSFPASINTSSILFMHIPAVFAALQLTFEELQLNKTLSKEVESLVPILYQIAMDLRRTNYVDYYCRKFPSLFNSRSEEPSQIKEEHLTKLQYPGIFFDTVLSVDRWVNLALKEGECGQFPYIPGVCNLTKSLISLYAVLVKQSMTTEQAVDRCLKKLAPAGHRGGPISDLSLSRSFSVTVPTNSVQERMVLIMTDLGMTLEDLECLPIGLSLPLREAIFHCRYNPPSDWPEEPYVLIGRQDLAQLLSMGKRKIVSSPRTHVSKPYPRTEGSQYEEDGMEHLDQELLQLRFSEDLRVSEARRLLQSSRPARIALTQRPEVSDHDFIEEQERHLYNICIRTMALPVGRGLFTLCTYHPLPTEPLPIPKLCLQGRAPPRNATVDLTHIDTPANMNSWPQFHNGVAAGLRMADFSQIDSTWILYNKPKGNELTNEYAGFLMALGLNEHLIHLHSLNVHDYLSKGSEMTTVGLLLGLAAAKRGTMDFATTRILSIHVAAFLPPTSTELNVPHNVQVAAILGIGLVYQGTAHRHTSEVLLSEIGRPPGPELDNCTDRESYSLAAGLALGLVMFGKGNEVIGTSDLGMADTLCHYMTGGHKRPLIGSNKERYKAPSYQIREGDNINVDVTSPGATLALGMLYFRTNNSAVIDWLRVPDTQFMLDQVRPDFLMLRTISRGLVSWDYVVPSFEWIKSLIPQILQEKAFERKQGEGDDIMVDYETMSQSYCNVVAGGCLVIGLKFAGTANQMAFGTLMKSIKLALTIMSSQSHVEQTGRGVLENCMVTILLSLAMVMAGSGNLEVLRLCRMLRSRIGPPHNIFVTYGSHMAISMAVGLLFIGGGRYSLSTTPEAIGIMLCAFFPKFPFHSNDNRYHLQAFRHLYVLATEPRVVLPRDVDSGEPCYVPLEITFKDTEDYTGEVFKTSAPTLLPQLDKIKEVKILGPRYWPITFQIDKNWNTLQLLLKRNGVLFVKQRAGYLSYVLDPKGYRSVLAKSLTSDHSSHTSVQPDVIKAFTTDPVISSMADYFLMGKDDCQRNRTLQKLSSILYSCVTQEKPEVISTHLTLDQVLNQSDFSLSHPGIRQLKNIFAYYYSPFNLRNSGNNSATQLLQMEFLLALKSQLEDKLDKWQEANMEAIVKYLQTNDIKQCNVVMLSAYIAWYDIPTPEEISKIIVEGGPTLPGLCSILPQLPVKTVMQILTAWQAAV
uniref:Anaphase-promoting complex subunit 1-like n=1 Tax=Crassostrea virginica TaxID=6565 RepID=A0A8B8E1A5_CRAVI|nr:anaphase-promoting complex subunit 1-like [Crassostrea virginica]XP_022333510.1 anaphase-promoting complex subunit 1-like [Crassostrea virginica]